jgi:serine/threonine protein kinase
VSVGSFRLLRRLAIGGMGEVFLAIQNIEEEERQVALKRVLPHLVNERQFVDRFVDEARLMTRLDHKNILPVYELRHDEWGLYMVMEYLAGHDVRTINRALVAQDDRWPPHLAVWLIKEVCEGLEYAHNQRGVDNVPLHLIHRDVSPSNILLSDIGEVKLIDFGVARAHGNIHQSITGALQGKLAYMSPEQARGQEINHRSDLYSVGMTLYEMIAGVRPREGYNDAEMLKIAQEGQDLEIEDVWPEGDQALCAIINQTLAHEPESRFSSAQELSDTLGEWLMLQGDQSKLKSEFIQWRDGLELHRNDHALSLNEAMELQLLSGMTPTPNVASSQETLSVSLDSHTQIKADLKGTMSGVLVTAERDDFSAILTSIVDDSTILPPSKTEVEIGEQSKMIGRQIRLPLVILLGLFVMSAILFYSMNQKSMSAVNVSIMQRVNGQSIEIMSQAHDRLEWREAITVDGQAWHPQGIYPSAQPVEICITHKDWRPYCGWFRLEELTTLKVSDSDTEPAQPTAIIYLKPKSMDWSPHLNQGDERSMIETEMIDPLNSQFIEYDKDFNRPDKKTLSQKGVIKSLDKTTKKRKTKLSDKHQNQEVVQREWLIQVKGIKRDQALTLRCGKSPQLAVLTRLKADLIKVKAYTGDKCQAMVDGYASLTFKLSLLTPLVHKIELKPKALVSLRVHPPAARIFLDGVELNNPIQKKEVIGSEHKLRAIYEQNQGVVEREWNLVVTPGQRVKRFFDLTQSE